MPESIPEASVNSPNKLPLLIMSLLPSKTVKEEWHKVHQVIQILGIAFLYFYYANSRLLIPYSKNNKHPGIEPPHIYVPVI